MDFPAPSLRVRGYTTLTYIEFIASGKYTRNYRSKCYATTPHRRQDWERTSHHRHRVQLPGPDPRQDRGSGKVHRPLDQEGRGTKESPNDTETGSELENAVPESEL
ncbi:hypothetical protein ARSEF1564_010003 [Beauveria bassiana]